MAELLFREGRGEQGLATLREVVERWPEDPWGYISLADAYAHLFYDAPFPRDVRKANEWLDRALGEAHLDKYEREAIEERRESYAEPLPDRSRRAQQAAHPV